MKTWKAAFRAELRRFKRERMTAWIMVGSALIVSVITVWLNFFTAVGDRLDLWLVAIAHEVRGPRPAPKEVVLVVLNNESYLALEISPRLPFPRKFTAEVLERVIEANPKVTILDARIPKEDLDPAADERLERAIRNGRVTIFSGRSPTAGSADVEKDPENATFTIPNDPRFTEAAKMLIDMWVPSSFGTVYHITNSPSPVAPLNFRVPLARPLIELGNYALEIPGPRDLINYYGPPKTITRINFHEVLNMPSETLSARLGGKVVLVGFASNQKERDRGKDEFRVPAPGGSMFGVEIHATIAANLIDRTWLHRLKLTDEILYVWLGALVFSFIGILVPFLPSLILNAGIAAAGTSITYYLFTDRNMWIALTGPALVCALLTVAANQTFRYLRAEKKNKQNEDFWDFDSEE